MKVEIDLNEVFDGENLNEAVQRQVVDNLVSISKRAVTEKIETEVSERISEIVKTQLDAIAPGLVSNLLDHEYTPISRYGSRDVPTTMRKEFLKALQDQITYKKTSYSSDKNAFTKAVDDALDAKMSEFKSQYNKQVDEQFLLEAYDYALLKLKERLKI